MNVICSFLCFTLFLLLGDVLMFLTLSYLYLLPLFLLYLLVLKGFYKDANCRSLEAKDIGTTVVFILLSAMVLSALHIPLDATALAYLFLSSFISLLLYIDSIRFKSLM